MGKRITIVGANSYIARNMIYLLGNMGDRYELFLYDIQDNHMDAAENYQRIDVLSEEDMAKVRLDVDAIYLFTGKTGSEKGFVDYGEFIKINELFLLVFLNQYRKQEAKPKVIYPSTRLVYQGKEGMLQEEDAKQCNSVYAINKYACEQYLELYNKAFDIPYSIFRICVPYGTLIEGASSYGTAEFMWKQAMDERNIRLYGDGNVRRTITHIEDICNILIAGGLSGQCLNDVYNIGGEDYSLLEMANIIAGYLRINVSTVPWPLLAERIESGNTVFDDRKLRYILRYRYQHTFEEWCAGFGK